MEIKFKILHGADSHVKVKNESEAFNIKAIENNLSEIRDKIIETKAEIFIFAGDLFDTATPTDLERKIVYKFLGEILHIESLKEFVFMCGNHDILSDKKRSNISKYNNSFDTLTKFIETLAPELSNKVTYLKHQKQYISKFNNNVGWISYSLEDGKSNGNNIDWDNVDVNKYNISVFHDILRDYAEDSKLPVRKDKLDSLPYLSDFNTELILAGDIHKDYSKTISENGKRTFIYPGSTNQVNYGEGTYLKIRNNCSIINADEKVLKLHEISLNVNTENCTLISRTTSNINLTNQLSYVTIDLDSNKKIDDYLIQIDGLLSLNKFGNVHTAFKLKLSSTYVSEEFELHKFITDYCNKRNLNHSILVNYCKFKINSDGTNNENQEILSTITNDEDNFYIESIDEIKLDEDKLNLLFETVLSRNIDKIKNTFDDAIVIEDIKSTVKSLFSEQIGLLISAKPNYNIQLMSIETKGFMGTGENKINLNVPGITKINGTNGVGKTTLYNMIYYVIEGMVFDYLSKSRKKQNTLLIFNDEKIYQDVIVVRLLAKVNGVSIAITRNALRKWKNNTTDEQKKSLEWTKYISEVQTSIRLDIAGKEEQKVFTGDEAETYVKNFFGDIANSILILNSNRINKLLNSQPDKLKSMILDYIGVDYLNSMKENLPFIKKQYNLQRPKTNLETLKSDFDTERDNLSQLETNNYLSLIKELNDSKLIQSDKLKQITDELINMGNIDNLIIENDDKLNQLIIDKQTLVSENTGRLLDLPEEWNIQSPIKPLRIQEIDGLIDIQNNDIISNKQSLELINNSIVENKNNLINLVKDSYKNYNSSLDNMFTDELKDSIVVEISKWTQLKQIQTVKLLEVINPIINDFNVHLDKWKNNEKTLSEELNNQKVIWRQLRDELESGVCNGCKKPLSDNWEVDKQIIIEKKESTANIITELDSKIKEVQNKILLIDGYIKIYGNLISLVNSDNINQLIQFEFKSLGVEIIINNVTEFIDVISVYNNKKLFFENILNNFNNENWKEFHNFNKMSNELHVFYDIYVAFLNKENTVRKYQEVIELILKDEFSSEVLISNLMDLNIPETIDLIKITINNLLIDKQSIGDNLNKFTEDIKSLNNEKEILTNTYNTNLQQYNTDYQKYNDDCKRINDHNKSIEDIINKIKLVDVSIDNCNITKDKLILLKPKYGELNNSSNICKNKINEFENQINNYEKLLSEVNLNINNSKHKLDNIQKDIDNWLSYKKDTYIYELYEKLINQHFPDIVFEYYRTYLNNYLNVLLSDMDFKLYWDNTGDLYMIKFDNGNQIFRPVQLVSGMQTVFLGLSLIYTICILNVKNNISHLFIDELSGVLNTGKELTKTEEQQNIIDFQEQFVLLINKFSNKSVWIIDHNINNLFETQIIEVVANKMNNGSKFIVV